MEHINTSGHSIGVDAFLSALGTDYSAHYVNDLDGARAINYELSVGTDNCKVFIIVIVGYEHQLEAALVVRRPTGEGVARILEQVHIGTCEVVDQVEN